MLIGNIYKFDYESKSKSKEHENPVKIKLTDAIKNKLIKEIQANAQTLESNHNKLVEELKIQNYFENIKLLEKLDQERKARGGKAPRKNQEQKDLEVLIQETFTNVTDKKEISKAKEKSITDLFFRQYLENNIDIKEDGKYEAILVNKDISKSGDTILRFINLGEIITEKADLYQLDGYEVC